MSKPVRPDVLVIESEMDIVRVRQSVRETAISARFSLVEQTKLVTAASELARNTLVHGGGGEVTIAVERKGMANTIRLTFTDRGRGIPDIEQAMADGYTTNSGLGLGLGGARRLVHEFDIKSTMDTGTTVSIGFTSRYSTGSPAGSGR